MTHSENSSALSCWMRCGQLLEPILANYSEILDGWLQGGVQTIVIGRLYFRSEADGRASVPAFQPNEALYRGMGLEPPATSNEFSPRLSDLLKTALGEAKHRGFRILVFCPEAGMGPGGPGHILADEKSLLAKVARVRDVMEQFPMVDGGIFDGPEFGYEIAHGHRSNIFSDLPDSLRDKAESMGHDFDRLMAGRDNFRNKLTSLDGPAARRLKGGGFFQSLELFGPDPGIADWLRFRRELLTDYQLRLREGLRCIGRPVLFGMGTRSPCFAPLNGYDFHALFRAYDFVLPKHYFFHRGFDGLYGTVGRYVETLTDWNPGLQDSDALRFVESLFGLDLPWLETRFDLELGFPAEFFERVVHAETRKALAAARAPDQVVPWVDTGREPHMGDPVNSGDLYRILIASGEAGLRQFLFHSHHHLLKSEWAVISKLCGEPWHEGRPGYCPQDRIAYESVLHRGEL